MRKQAPNQIRVAGHLYRKAEEDIPVSPYSPGLAGESGLLVFTVGGWQVAVWTDSVEKGLDAAVDWLKEEHPDDVWDEAELWEEAKIWFKDAEGREPEGEEELSDFLHGGDDVTYTDSGWIDSDWGVHDVDITDDLYEEIAARAADEGEE